MKNGLIIYSKDTLNNKFNNNAFDWMNAAALENGLHTTIVFEEDLSVVLRQQELVLLHNGLPLALPGFVLLRSYCFEIAEAFEMLGVLVFNSTASLAVCRNKWTTHLYCSRDHLAQPETVFKKKDQYHYADMAALFGPEFICKEVFGSQGAQVYLINNETDFRHCITASTSELICQEYIREAAGTDIRVHVIGDRALVGVERKSKEGFKSNFSLGGTAREVILDDAIKSMAVRAARCTGLDIAGVDILLSARGPLLCEVNGIPAFRAVAQASPVNIPYHIFEYIKDRLNAAQ